MSHLVLARKYRPQFFEQVVGQEVVVSTIKAAIEKNRIAHAMLFTGSRGVGKTTIARLVAKALVCTQRDGAEPCGKCAQCSAIDNFSSLDVIEIDGASHTGVDDVRELRDSARYQPTSAKYKIFIIDEVHMLSISAFNALLKILEEPPAHVIFIFATTEAHKIPKTILSRCQRYDFKRVAVAVIQKALRDIVKKEALNFADDALLLISELADGGMRDALSILEQVITSEREVYSSKVIAEILGVVSHQAVRQLAYHLIEQEVGPALAIVKEVYESGLDLCQLSDALAARFRVLSLSAHLDDFKEASTLITGLEEEEFNEAHSFERADLKRLFAMALDGMAQVFQAKKPLLALELLVLRLAMRPPMSEATTINFCLNKLDAILHNRPVPLELPKEHGEQMKAQPPKKDTPKPEVKSANVLELFSVLLNQLSEIAPSLASHLRHAQPSVRDGVLHLSFSLSLHYEFAQQYKSHPQLLKLVRKIYEQSLEISLELLKSAEPQTKESAKTVAQHEEQQIKAAEQALYDEASSHPIVKKTLEIFGGDIATVEKIPTHDLG
ncbi:MAG: DNA polymerase III subunit gamma/tau [Myxococcales bacterium]|nr:DNA polymerase III subunit gamma/tau [Myxococcales bacterium]USN49967.1 MAG: DNA polymerase III subunit gamma/tau [Myxococcales bacterium]